MTREDWLNKAQERLKPFILEGGASYPKMARVSCGFPGGVGRARVPKVLGQCWDTEASEDEVGEIFVSPILSDTVMVLATLLHEMIHHAVGCDAKHGAPFKRVAVKVGLEGKMTATYPGEVLTKRLAIISEQLGPYPHSRMNLKTKEKKAGTRMLKIECPGCGWVARTTQQRIEEGLPTCHCGQMLEHKS